MTDNDRFTKAAKTLEFSKILQMLAECATTEGAKEEALAAEPYSDKKKITELLKETDDCRRLYISKGEPSFGQIKNILSLIERADKGAVLSAAEILECANVLRTARGVADYYKTEKKFETSVDVVFERLMPDRAFEREIYSAIISADTIADDASSALSDIRRKIRNANSKIRETLQKYITGESYSKYLQENIITLRNGRYVIPVKQEYRNEIKGLVHDTSSSGATLFIEPMAAVDANNELKVLERAEHEEIERILSDFSARISERSDILKLDYYNLTYLSYAFARGKLAVRLDAFMPEYTDKRKIELLNARHPLLEKSKAVPITVRLGGDYDTLVITGPNTGGKTVTEKTIGLLVMMAQTGLHIPADEGSKLCIFDGISADIGDEQSIEQSLSTFSAHMVNIVGILNEITDKSLVLFDELGAGTDPVEGAALAVAILEEVRKNGALCAATTHYAELKAYAIETPGVMNASCEFDVETLKPTYRLIIGAPGRSNAFAIASKLGLSQDILERAASAVNRENKRFEDVITKLDEQRTEMTAAKEETERLKAELEKYKAESEEKIRKNLERSEAELAKAQEIARKTVESARASAEFIYAELDRAKKQQSKEERQKALEQSRAAVREKLAEYDDIIKEPEDDGYVLPRMPKTGETVYLRNLKTNAVVKTEPDKNGMLAVESGVMKIKVRLSDIRIGEEYTSKKTPKKKETPKLPDFQPTSVKSEIDLRGKNGEEAWHETDLYLDFAKRGNLGQVTLIHGKGTGKLREILRDRLKRDSRVASFREGVWGEGDAGVTVVTLK